MRALRLLLYPLTWPFGIRESTGRATRLVLAAVFGALVFGLWIWATDNPAWLNAAIVRMAPEYRLAEGDRVVFAIDDDSGQLNIRKEATGKTLVRDLPRMAPAALPAFDKQAYAGLFADLERQGLGRFEQIGDHLFHATIVDAAVARERLRGVGPFPSELPLEVGETVDIVINFNKRMARFVVDRVGRSVEGAGTRLGTVPPPDGRYPPELGHYGEIAGSTYLEKIAERLGITELAPHPEADPEAAREHDTAKLFSGQVADLDKAAEWLGPKHPTPALDQGDTIAVELDRRRSMIVLYRVDKAAGEAASEAAPASSEPAAAGEAAAAPTAPAAPPQRPRKREETTVTTAMLATEAVPPLSLASYPDLAALVASEGIVITSAPDEPLEARVADVALARKAGLGLEKPQEMRTLTSQQMPSPSEVVKSLPLLLERHLVFGEAKADEADSAWGWKQRSARWIEGQLRAHDWLAFWVGWNEPDPVPTARQWSPWQGAIYLTVERVCRGFFWALVVTLPLGLLMGSFSRIASLFEPLRLTGMYIPLPALIPLTLAWAGLGEGQIVTFLAISTGVVLLPFVVASVQGLPQVYLDTARTLGATRGQQFRFVLLSVSWSTIFRGLRVSFAVGWTWMMLAEMNGVQNGLGYIINTSQRRGLIEHVYVVIALVILLAFIANTLWNAAVWVLFPYERHKES